MENVHQYHDICLFADRFDHVALFSALEQTSHCACMWLPRVSTMTRLNGKCAAVPWRDWMESGHQYHDTTEWKVGTSTMTRLNGKWAPVPWHDWMESGHQYHDTTECKVGSTGHRSPLEGKRICRDHWRWLTMCHIVNGKCAPYPPSPPQPLQTKDQRWNPSGRVSGSGIRAYLGSHLSIWAHSIATLTRHRLQRYFPGPAARWLVQRYYSTKYWATVSLAGSQILQPVLSHGVFGWFHNSWAVFQPHPEHRFPAPSSKPCQI